MTSVQKLSFCRWKKSPDVLHRSFTEEIWMFVVWPVEEMSFCRSDEGLINILVCLNSELIRQFLFTKVDWSSRSCYSSYLYKDTCLYCSLKTNRSFQDPIYFIYLKKIYLVGVWICSELVNKINNQYKWLKPKLRFLGLGILQQDKTCVSPYFIIPRRKMTCVCLSLCVCLSVGS